LIQERFLYLLVDEHQDTNDAQNFIIGMIAEFFETPNIFIVGDENKLSTDSKARPSRISCCFKSAGRR